ncbi:response regulator [Leptolyngbya sp. FACHB-261]|uniref:response regulator n=1 Tax=Leptolyngbya sp. FACHB-261 TaxID=2692806 RepID=UPI001682DF62|nr:response regulator [Leptolyngbya sp. FACHB-261]MBD2099864.1 response regulator [Leptolyngbya sp. FACHB-261]
MSPPRFLLIDDNPADRILAIRQLRREFADVKIVQVTDAYNFELALTAEDFDLVITDYQLGWSDGLKILQAIKARYPACPVVMFTNTGTEEIAVEGMKSGLDDYVIKSPQQFVRLPLAARSALERAAARRLNARLQAERDQLLERERLEQRNATFLAEASKALASSLDPTATLTQIARLGASYLADACVVYLIRNEDQLMPVELAHAQAQPEAELRELLQRYPHPNWQGPVTQVLHTGQSQLVTEVTVEYLAAIAQDAEHLRLLQALSLQSLLAVPLVARTDTLGVLSLISSQPQRRFGTADQVLSEEFGRRAAIAIDNARLYQQAETANQLKDEFLATLSHELRTPLNSMLGWAQLIRVRRLDDATYSRAVEAIERNTKSLNRLIDDLLDVSRIITGNLRLEVNPVELIPVISEALAVVQPASQAKAIRIETALDASVGPVLGDATRLQQVAWNLLANAIKFTPEGGQVRVTLTRISSQAALVISDTGQGINPEFLPHVFERFRQADGSTTRTHGGLGLGLAIVRQLIELQGGTVQAQSDGVGRGATFIVKLPLLAVRAKPGERPTAQGQLPSLSGLRILVVDDEADARALISTVLEACGAEVATATSVAEALTVLLSFQPDALVSDIGMPGENGYELMRRLREQGQQLPAIALTAYAKPEDQERALAAGFQRHLAKPTEPVTLVATLSSLLNR